MLAISPHCDDAVFACGERLCAHPGALVVTVFAGDPPPGTPLRAWDRDCGFRASADVMPRRREEDRRAFAALGVRGEWLAFRDSQYGDSPAAREIAATLEALIVRELPRQVCFPLGLFHSDHTLVSEAALSLVALHPETTWYAYEDALYRSLDESVEERVDALRRRGFVLRAVTRTTALPTLRRKRAAIACYRSQLRGLCTPRRLGHRDALAPEAYWSVRA
jgi:LmbE family N-acetylglucosaminyl deacetylase